jgi:phosphoenolpyruvate carboxylase
MPAGSIKTLESALKKDFSKAVAEEILDMILKLGKKQTAVAKVEEAVVQYIRDHIEKNVTTAIKNTNDIINNINTPFRRIVKVPGSKPKSKK